MSPLGDHAVVLGASMGGLLAARVLADCYQAVTVVERDELPDGFAQRRGVPQGRHAHALLNSGSHALSELFPGMLDELVAAGALALDDGNLSRIWLRYNGHDLSRSGAFTKPIVTYLASRPFLESHVRRRLRALGNVTMLDYHDVVALVAAGPDRVVGARVADRDTGTERVLSADLVVDAMGRAGRTPAFLEANGYSRPEEDHIVVDVSYASQLLQVPPGTLAEKLILVGPVPERPSGGVLLACENNTWMVTLSGLVGHEPPTDRGGMLDYAAEFAPPQMMAALEAAEPLTGVSRYRYPTSQRRRYDRMRWFPEGLLVFGDAMCSFNPIYGQGMSVAALEAIVLRDCLARGDRDLGRRFFRAAAKPVGAAWQMASGADLALPQVQGRRSIQLRLANRYTERLLTAAESDPMVNEAFFRVMNLVDPPARLLHPQVVRRVATARRRRAVTTPDTHPTSRSRVALEVIDKGACSDAHPTPLLFVHGAWHAAWCWDEHFLDFFADRGYRAIALSLRGHGGSAASKPLRRCSVADYVDDVAAVADTLPAPPVLIGHSMGGFVVQKYLESHEAPVGVLLASISPRGALGFDLRLMKRYPWNFTKSTFTGKTLPCFDNPERAREFFFSTRVPEADVVRYAAQLQEESQRAGLDITMLGLAKPKRVTAPLLVLGAEFDCCITQREVHATARAYRTEAEFFPDMGHDMMLEPGWRAVAERIDSWLGKHPAVSEREVIHADD